MKVIEFLNFFKYLRPALYSTVNRNVEDLLHSNLKSIYEYIISNISTVELSNIYLDKSSWDKNSEFEVIQVIIRTGIYQEVVFRFFYSIAKALDFIFCNRNFDEWYITNGWTTDVDTTYFDKKAPFDFCLPRLILDYNKKEMYDRGVEIELDYNPELLLSRGFGKYNRTRCEVVLNLNVNVIIETTKIKALCMALYDVHNNMITEGRIAQWYIADDKSFKVRIKFNCLPEKINEFFNRLYLFWESSKKDLNYNGSWTLE